MDVDRDTLAALFASRVQLVKKTEDEAAQEARLEHRKAVRWIASDTLKKYGFRWYCDEFELDPGAVRKAIDERKA